MIFKDLLVTCSAKNVVDEIQKQFSKASSDKQLLLQQVNQLLQELAAETDYFIPYDKNFCFMAVPKTEEKQSIYVGLYDIEEDDKSGGWEYYKIRQVTDWGFGKYQCLGIEVFEPSLKKYGVDCIVAGVLGLTLVGD